MTPLGRVLGSSIGRATDKLVLIALASAATKEGTVMQSIADLAKITELDRKSVVASLGRLVGAGWLVQTAERAGATGRVPVYQIACDNYPLRTKCVKHAQATLTDDNAALTAIGPKTGSLNRPKNGTISPGNEPKNGTIAAPVIGPKTGPLRPSRSTESSSTESLSKNILYKLPTPVQPENPISTTTRETEKSEPANPQADNTLTLTPPPVSAAKPQRSSPRPKAALTQIPDTWEPSEKGLAFAAQRGVIAANEAPRFVAHHQQKGSLMASWDAAWRTWCLNQERWRKEDAAKARGVTARDVAQGESYRPSELRTAL